MTAMGCKILRVETSAETPPRKRYICSCGRVGFWERDYGTWRNITADRAVQWNWKVHAGNMGKRRRQAPVMETPPTLRRMSPDIAPGVRVEWEPEYASGTMRAVVTHVADGRVFVELERPRSPRARKPPAETWFEADEVHRLRVVKPQTSQAASTPQIDEHW